MSSPAISRLLRHGSRNAPKYLPRTRHVRRTPTAARAATALTVRAFSTSKRHAAGMMPHTEDPQPPSRVEDERTVTQATEIDEGEFHIRADEYLNAVAEKAEAIQEEKDDVEVEFSAGVLNISLPPAGTYVLNKQPPNKQIWLSSPTSGPKRFDWVLVGESMDQKEGGGVGDWIYLRDGTSLTDLLSKEMGIQVDLHGHEESMAKQSVDPVE